MALTRAKITNVDSSQNYFTDPMTVLRQGATSANVDVGFLFNRANGLVSNVALYWSESGNTFVTAFTSNTGVNNGNILVSSYTNLATGALSVTGTGSFTGNLTTGHILPSANITYDIGSPTLRFRTLYISGNTIDMGGAQITTDSTSGGFAFVPKPTSANPNPLGTVFSPTGAITTINTTGGVIAAGAINTSINNNQGTANFGNVQVNSNVSSTSTVTGALIVTGGAGISGNLYIGGVYIGSGGTNGLFWAANNAAVSTGGGASSGSENAYIRTSFTATADQTTFSAVYTAGYIQVYANGVLLNAADYTATNGSTVVLNTGRVAGDIVETVAFSVVVASGYSANTIVYSNAAGYLTSSNSLTYDGITVTATKFAGALNGTVGATTPSTVVATSVTNSGLTSGRITYASTGGLLVDSANLVFTGTSVGIGTDSPADTLNIGTGKKFRATHSANVYQQIFSSVSGNFLNAYGDNFELNADSGAIYLTVTAAQPMVFQTTNTERMRVSAAGLVGIGTTSPDAQLDVTRSGNGQIAVLQTSASRGFSFDSQSDTALQIASIQASTNMNLWANTLSFSAGGSERMRILADGNVGIGTDSPAFLTEIVGGATTVETTLFQVRSNAGGIGTGSTIAMGNSTNTTAGSGRVELAAIRTTSSGGSFVIRTGDDSGTIQDRMRIDSAGNVGIGTSPSTMLHLRRDTTSASAPAYPNIRIDNPNAAGYTALYFYQDTTQKAGFELSNASGALQFVGTSSEWMRITSAGLVGIGTSSPVQKLQVNGAAGNPATSGSTQNGITRLSNTTDNGVLDIGIKSGGTGAWLQSTDGGASGMANQYPLLLNPVGGNVGIGTSTPSAKLNVVGGVTFQNTTCEFGVVSTTANQFVLQYMASGNGYYSYMGVNGAGAGVIDITGITDNAVFYGVRSSIVPLQFITNNAVRATIDSSGNVGIGTSSPTNKLQVTGGGLTVNGTSPAFTANAAIIDVSGSITRISAAGPDNTTNGTMAFNTASANAGVFNERMRIDSSGNLLLGTTSQFGFATGKLVVEQSAATFLATMQNSNAIPYGMYIKYSGAAPNNTSNEFIYCHDGTLRFSAMSNGGISNYSANNTNLSDERTKKDIANAGNYLDKICAIPVRTFLYKDQVGSQLNLGVIAQEVEKVAPELIDNSGFGETPEDGIPLKAIYQTDLQYALMKCIQEQQALIESLTTRLTALENK